MNEYRNSCTIGSLRMWVSKSSCEAPLVKPDFCEESAWVIGESIICAMFDLAAIFLILSHQGQLRIN